MRDEIEQYRQQNVQPFGINPAGVEQHAAYAAKLALPFPLLSDRDLAITHAYGATNMLRRLSRSVVLIGQDGRVVFASPGAPGADLSLEGLAP